MNTNDFDDQMKQLMAQGHAGTPQSDLASAAWHEGRRRRTRRLVAGGAGGTMLVAAAAATAFALSGGLPTENAQINPADGTGGGGQVTQDSAPQASETPTGSTESEPTVEKTTDGEPSDTGPTGAETAEEQDPPAIDGDVVIPTDVSGPLVPIGDGLGIISQDGWDVLPLRPAMTGSAGQTCLQPGGAQEPGCAISVVSWGELEPQPESQWLGVGGACLADPLAADNVVSLLSDGPVAQGRVDVDGHAAEWERWEVTCAGGETYSPAYWSIPDLSLTVSSDLHGDQVPQQLGGFDLSGAVSDLHLEVMVVTGESGGVLTGDLQEFLERDGPVELVATGETGALVTVGTTVCMDRPADAVETTPDGLGEIVIECGEFTERATQDLQTRPDVPLLLAILRDDAGDVVLVHRQYMA
ncbi:hypothetical protein [Ornithinimicrobium cryptoxanthini]|uniref:Uncharacterized protein n=1 Tax=Ornithinimicrobium cryptoxanthini TaxID=2934161 RepID=A0ABY4YEA2_9MICO|nr:hypothetical protein [Ornithinimicrobium cryptoxanthini]USQ75082.1 hypothetical protein NF557_10540 [Ornithinimicrobium cryptoxanthini]